MFEVLAFVYQHYDAGPTCPEASQLERQLISNGFTSDEVDEALVWLKGLDGVALCTDPVSTMILPQQTSSRVYPPHERAHLGTQAIGFLQFMENAGTLPAMLREIIIDRAMAAPGGPVSLDDLKIIMLLVYWRFGQEPDALILDELCSDAQTRVPH